MARFYSKEWVDQVTQKCATDAAYLKKAKNYTTPMLYLITDCPDGNDVKLWIDFQAGKMAKVVYKMAKAPSDFRTEPWNESISLCRIIGSYATYMKLQKRELTAMGALSSKLYKIEGDYIKIMAHLGNFTAALDLWATVPCEY